ncbi:hypothetical protein [Halobacillus andaensis]|uniref:hypothetical protein n=1 Tax=Halobacillus andaensis TaxID=1176239 RepID=UPI00166DC2BC|nr:hypothetical protein [Halobacillus andaensis]MBP2005195.1 hypothetical protein [Halobacillus andaensis]
MKKNCRLLIVLSMILMAFSPGMERVQAAENSPSIDPLSEQKQQEVKQLENELHESMILEFDIVTGLDERLSSKPTYDEQTIHQPYEPETKEAPHAAKQMIQKLQNTGEYAWNLSIEEYTSKLPITADAKRTFEEYLGYQYVMETLTIAAASHSDITDALSSQMQHAGMPSWLSGVAARTLVFLLL